MILFYRHSYSSKILSLFIQMRKEEGYCHFQEFLSISKIYQHIYEDKDQHMQFTINEVDRHYNTQIIETRRKHAADDNIDLKQQKLSKDLEALHKLKGANYR